MGPINTKRFVLCAMGYDPNLEANQDLVNDDEVNYSVSNEQPFAGLVMDVHCEIIQTRAGNAFTKHNWFPCEEMMEAAPPQPPPHTFQGVPGQAMQPPMQQMQPMQQTMPQQQPMQGPPMQGQPQHQQPYQQPVPQQQTMPQQPLQGQPQYQQPMQQPQYQQQQPQQGQPMQQPDPIGQQLGVVPPNYPQGGQQ
jgi:hypothetical protein